jgi:anti-sigma B factor antagonist
VAIESDPSELGDLFTPPEGPALTASLQQVDDYALIEVTGELDIATRDLLVATAEAALELRCDRLIISCTDLDFVDSSGLQALISIRAACAGRDTKLFLTNTGRQLTRLLETTGLTDLFR